MITNGLVFYNDPRNTACYPTYNLLKYTEQFDNSVWWMQGGASILADQVANPINGNIDADKLIESTNAGFHLVQQTTSPISLVGASINFSVYAKAGERTGVALYPFSNMSGVKFDLTNGVIISMDASGNFSANIQSIGNGWYKCSVSQPITSSVANYTANTVSGIYILNSVTNYTGDGVSGLYIWGAQLTYGSSLQPYQKVTIPSTNTYNLVQGISAIGTLVNSPKFDGNSFIFNGTNNYISPITLSYFTSPAECTMDLWVKYGGSGRTIFAINYALGSGSAIVLGLRNNGGTMMAQIDNIGSGTQYYNFPSLLSDRYYKVTMVFSLSLNSFKVYLDGVLVSTLTTSGNLNSAEGLQESLAIGFKNITDGEYAACNIGPIAYYNRALSATEVQQNYNDLKGRFQ